MESTMKRKSVCFVLVPVLVILICCLFRLGFGKNPSPKDLILLKTGSIDTSQKAADIYEGRRLMGLSRGDQAYYIVQFTGPVKEEWKKRVRDVGGILFDYLPNNAFIVKMGGDVPDTVMGFPEIKWVGLYQPAFKVAPQLSAAAPGMEQPVLLTVQTFEPGEIGGLRNSLQNLGGSIVGSGASKWGGILRVRIAPSLVSRIINLPSVKWVEQYTPPTLLNDKAVTSTEMNVTDVWNTHGLRGAGQIVAVADSGLDVGVNDTTLHPDFQGAVFGGYGLGIGRGGDWGDQHGHGTHVAGSVLGRGTASGGTYKGVAHEAQLIIQSVLSEDGSLSGIPTDLYDLFVDPYNDGARIHSNSWGAPVSGEYTVDSQRADQFMWDHKDMLVVFAAGNSGMDEDWDGIVDTLSLASPGTAKNVLTVGASENERSGPAFDDFTWYYFNFYADPLYSDPTTDNPDGMAGFSSRGPCMDGRIKPDVVAPGTFIGSTRTHKYGLNDMMETSDTSLWTSDSPWSYVPHGAEYKWSTGGADPGAEASLAMAAPADLRMGGSVLFFQTNYDLGDDLAYIDIDDTGTEWVPLVEITGSSEGWTDVVVDLGLYIYLGMINLERVQFRFRIVSGGGTHGTGWEIHQVRIYNAGWARFPDMEMGSNWDATDENYIFMGGSSMATPLTAGAAAVVRQYYTDREGISPSAALIKGTLITGATDMPGQYIEYELIDGPRPNVAEGWGRVNLENTIFPAAPRVLKFVDEPYGLLTSWRRAVTFHNNSAAHLTVTLVWTDYPSTPAAGVNLVNDLDVVLTDPDSTMHFPNGLGTYDRVNNVEVIDLSSPLTGEYTVTISGYSVPQGPQPFALVVTGDVDNFRDHGTVPTLVIGLGSYPSDGGRMEVFLGDYVHTDWLQVGWAGYNAANGEARLATGDIDGDGRDEIVIGLGAGSAGYFQVLEDDYSHLGWGRIGWSGYNSANGETWPACGDIDGDGKDEIVVGLGSGSGGFLEIFDYDTGSINHKEWIRVNWKGYNTANGETRPACGDIDGDGIDEIVVGLGTGSGGFLEVFDDAGAAYAHLAWPQVQWKGYNTANGESRPACGDLDGDGIDEIVVGLGTGSGGFLEVFDDGVAAYAHLAWPRVQWKGYNTANGETRPACGDLDADGKDEIVVGLGVGAGGYLEVLDDASGAYAHVAWPRVQWNEYNSSSGETWPTVRE
jgi:subtilisin family serine protease